jgi:hypothetical protein
MAGEELVKIDGQWAPSSPPNYVEEFHQRKLPQLQEVLAGEKPAKVDVQWTRNAVTWRPWIQARIMV